MPDNSSIMGFNYDTEESAVEKLKTAPERLEVFIQQIRKKEKGIFNDYEGDTPEESTRELAKLIEPYSVTAPSTLRKINVSAADYVKKSAQQRRFSMQINPRMYSDIPFQSI